ncbi:MAG: FGGY-family carbohydrate kinase [bacterium]
MSEGAAGGRPAHILAIDMGTGTAKAALVAADGRIAGTGSRPIETTHLPRGGAEQDPEQWWDAVTAAARQALESSGLAPERVVAVRCTTQWAVTVPVDEAGRALSPAISWMDTRGAPYVRELAGGPISIAGYDLRRLGRWLRLTGGAPVLSGVDGLSHVLYLKHERPEVYAAASALLEPMDYLNLRLTGRAAASFGTIYPYWLTDNRDPERVRYDSVLVRWSGIDRAKLPELLPVDGLVGTLTGEAARRLGLRAGTRVLTGLSDAQAAAVGAGIVEEGHGYLSIGTTSWLSCLVAAKKTDLRHLIGTMPGGLPGQHMVVAEQGPAGRCLEFLRDSVLYDGAGGGGPAPPPDAFEHFDREAAGVPAGSGGLIFTPWLAGVGAPSEDARTRSAFLNQSLETTRAHYVRAVMEGVAYNARWLKGHVERFARCRFDRLAFIGGGALSPTWGQILADVLGCEIDQVAEPRFANAAGAALAGFAVLGEIAVKEIPAAVKTATTYAPDPAAAPVHDRQFEHFLRFYKRNRRVYRGLNSA